MKGTRRTIWFMIPGYGQEVNCTCIQARRGAAPARQRNSGIISLIQEDDWKVQVLVQGLRLAGQLAELASSGAAPMMGEKISPCLAAVSPPRRWPRPARTGSLVRQSPSTIGTDRVSRRSRFQEVDPHWGTDSSTRPRPPTQVPTGQVQSSTTAETMAEHQGMQPARQSVRPANRAQITMERAPETSCIIYVPVGRPLSPPAKVGYCSYVCSTQPVQLRLIIAGAIIYGPSRPPQRQCHSYCNKTVKLFRVASMS